VIGSTFASEAIVINFKLHAVLEVDEDRSAMEGWCPSVQLTAGGPRSAHVGRALVTE
jgi:hypothetical protein